MYAKAVMFHHTEHELNDKKKQTTSRHVTLRQAWIKKEKTRHSVI